MSGMTTSSLATSAESVLGEILARFGRASGPCRFARAVATATESGRSKAVTPGSWPSHFCAAASAAATSGARTASRGRLPLRPDRRARRHDGLRGPGFAVGLFRPRHPLRLGMRVEHDAHADEGFG